MRGAPPLILAALSFIDFQNEQRVFAGSFAADSAASEDAPGLFTIIADVVVIDEPGNWKPVRRSLKPGQSVEALEIRSVREDPISWARVRHRGVNNDLGWINVLNKTSGHRWATSKVLGHSGEECWYRCGSAGGYCWWCGEGNACCRRGWTAHDPIECTRAAFFTTNHHECVLLKSEVFEERLSSSGQQVPALPSYGLAADGNFTMLLDQLTLHQPVESTLKPVLNHEASRLETELLPRARTPDCRKRIRALADYARHRFQRAFPRHPYAEQNCPVEAFVDDEGFLKAREDAKGAPLLNENRQPKCKATIAFLLLTFGWGVLSSRLLQRIFHPDHLYHISIDARPKSTARDNVEKDVQALLRQHGPAKYIKVSDEIDTLYGSPSLVTVFLLAFRDILQSNVPSWDFVINLSGSDYPIKSVDYMSRRLAYHGAVSYAETFLVSMPQYTKGRGLTSWFVECPEEPCLGSRKAQDKGPCQGQLMWLHSDRKPQIALSSPFGGSQWWVLHRDFVKHLWQCLADRSDQASTSTNGTVMDDATRNYCHSVRGMFVWYSSSFASDETFIQTALFNSPYCKLANSRSLRWVAWREGSGSCNRDQRSSTYKGKRPNCFTRDSLVSKGVAQMWKAPAADMTNAEMVNRLQDKPDWLIARKFSLQDEHFERALDVADDASASWDKLVEQGLFRCDADVGEDTTGSLEL